MSLAASLPLGIYRAVGGALSPLAKTLLRARLAKGKEDPARLGERLGIAGLPRPAGPLVWVHGASVGESLSALPLIEAILKSHPQLYILVTTGTVTSAALMKERLPQRALHQFVPLDAPRFVARFLAYWKPDLALWLESEFWPNLLLMARARGIKLVLVNARLSEKSHRGWTNLRPLAGHILSAFSLCLAQDEATAARLRDLGAANLSVTGNLKAEAGPLPADETELAALRSAIGNRPVWLAASTHKGEEEIAASVHRALAPRFPGLLTLIVPRHPGRGVDIANALREAGLRETLRSARAPLVADTEIYVADTLGELGLFFRLAGIVFMGGSLVPHGGQNPFEPACLECAILHGPHVQNFAEAYGALGRAAAALAVTDAGALTQEIARLLADENKRSRLGQAARKTLSSAGTLAKTLAALTPALAKLEADARS